MSGATYKSSQTSVAKVNKSTGLVTTKKVGTTKITATYKNKKVVIELQVVEAGTLGTTTTYKKLNTLAKKIYKAFISDPVKAVELAFQYEELFYSAYDNYPDIFYYGYGYDQELNRSNLVVPLGLRYCTLEYSFNPLSTGCANAFRVATDSANYFTASVSKNTLTLKLKSKVTEGQVAWLRCAYTQTSSKNTYFTVYIYDETDDKSYIGRVYVTAGSKKLTIRLYNEKGKRQAVQEGHIYYFAGPGFMSVNSSAAV